MSGTNGKSGNGKKPIGPPPQWKVPTPQLIEEKFRAREFCVNLDEEARHREPGDEITLASLFQPHFWSKYNLPAAALPGPTSFAPVISL